jgi:hypothetical protein
MELNKVNEAKVGGRVYQFYETNENPRNYYRQKYNGLLIIGYTKTKDKSILIAVDNGTE